MCSFLIIHLCPISSQFHLQVLYWLVACGTESPEALKKVKSRKKKKKKKIKQKVRGENGVIVYSSINTIQGRILSNGL